MKPFLVSILLLSVAVSIALAQKPAPPAQAQPETQYNKVLKHHELLFARLDKWDFSDLDRFFSDPAVQVPLIFTTDGIPSTQDNPGYHESWHDLDPLALIKRWSLTTGNKTRLDRESIQVSLKAKFAYACFDFERDCPFTSGKTGTFRFRSTSVLTHTKDGWRIVHLHISKSGGAQSGKWDVGVEGPR
ncbi:MAG: hypothetical protein ACI87O_000635 [Planctomycetota bacterium]|jgi:hypothetical protein